MQKREVSDDLLNRAMTYIKSVAENSPRELLYHDLKHAFDRDEAIEEIGKGVGLSYHELLRLRIAALFLDVSYWVIDGNQNTSATMATDFLKGERSDSSIIDAVVILIGFNRRSDEPSTTLEMILTDAINSLKTKKDQLYKLALLKKEEELSIGKPYSEVEWYRLNEMRLSNITFYTDFARVEYENDLEKTKRILSKRVKDLQKKMDRLLESELKIDGNQLKDLKKKLKKVEGRPDRGVETLFRLASGNHFTMNGMVDKKSSILISINSIILSIILGTVLQELERDPHLLVPVIMLSITNLWSIALAVFATRPESTHGENRGLQKVSQGSNLLFYGNFHHMTEQEYLDGMEALTEDSNKLYGSIASDVYYLGINLNHKFRLLRRSFNIFVYGFIISVITFLVCHVFFGQDSLFNTI